MRLFKRKRKLDERELMEMYKTEHYAFYFLYFAIIGDMLVKAYFLDVPGSMYTWEVASIFLVSVWIIFSDFRRGNYDYFTEPGWRSYSLYALASAAFFTGILILSNIRRGWIRTTRQGLLAGAIVFFFLFVCCYGVLAVFGGLTKRRRKRLEEQFDEEK